jgi:hypothetical protein
MSFLHRAYPPRLEPDHRKWARLSKCKDNKNIYCTCYRWMEGTPRSFRLAGTSQIKEYQPSMVFLALTDLRTLTRTVSATRARTHQLARLTGQFFPGSLLQHRMHRIHVTLLISWTSSLSMGSTSVPPLQCNYFPPEYRCATCCIPNYDWPHTGQKHSLCGCHPFRFTENYIENFEELQLVKQLSLGEFHEGLGGLSTTPWRRMWGVNM